MIKKFKTYNEGKRNKITITVQDILDGKYGELILHHEKDCPRIDIPCNDLEIHITHNDRIITREDFLSAEPNKTIFLRFSKKPYDRPDLVGSLSFVDKKEGGYAIMSFPVTKEDYAVITPPRKTKRIYSSEDPYGEEAWEDD